MRYRDSEAWLRNHCMKFSTQACNSDPLCHTPFSNLGQTIQNLPLDLSELTPEKQSNKNE
jgi:hypothetical protein